MKQTVPDPQGTPAHGHALIVRDGAMEVVSATSLSTLEALQKVVDGYIEPVFTIPSQTRGPRINLTGYANEEGWIHQLPPNVHLAFPDGRTLLIAGALAIIGLDTDDGESVGLTAEEVATLVLMSKEPGYPVLFLDQSPAPAPAGSPQ